MTELEVLARSINGLTELLRVARSDLANPILTSFERRELAHQIDRYNVELRRHLLLIEAERGRVRRELLKQSGGRHFSQTLNRSAETRRQALGG